MNILYFHPHFTYPGGAGKFVLETGERLAKMGHNVTVLAQSGDPEIIKYYSHINFIFIGGPLPNRISHWVQFPLLMKRIFEVTRDLDIDVIFPQVFPANYWGFLYKRRYPDIPCIWYAHDLSAFIHQMDWIKSLDNPMRTLAIISNPLIKLIDLNLVKESNNIIANSSFTSKFIKDTYGVNANVIHPGVDLAKFTISNNKLNHIFSVGRLLKVKKLDSLLHAMRSIQNVHLYIGGDGEDMERLVELSNELNINNKVTFLGILSEEELNYYYSTSKVVVFPSLNEPFGIVPIEAMASGIPVIAFESGGVVDSIIDGVTGYLVDPTNTDSLIMKINDLVTNSDLCSQMSKNTRAHVEKNFTWDLTAKRLNEFLISSVKS